MQHIRRVVSLHCAENVQGLTLPGSHITPCGTDLKWQIGAAGFSPQDALIMAVKQQSQVCSCMCACHLEQLVECLIRLLPLRADAMTRGKNAIITHAFAGLAR
eukprot:1137487-Pelagomonas_calceolata.AAC.6